MPENRQFSFKDSETSKEQIHTPTSSLEMPAKEPAAPSEEGASEASPADSEKLSSFGPSPSETTVTSLQGKAPSPEPSQGASVGDIKKGIAEGFGRMGSLIKSLFKGKGNKVLEIVNIFLSINNLIIIIFFLGLLILLGVFIMFIFRGLSYLGGNFAGPRSTDTYLSGSTISGGECGQAILKQAEKYADVCYSEKYHCANNIPIEKLQRGNCPTDQSAPGVDCSGFVSRVYRDLGLFPPNACYRTADILNGIPYLQEVSASQIQTGDLVVNPATGKSRAHVAIYVSGDVQKKFLVWESRGGDPVLGGGSKNQVRQAYRKPRPGQRYFHPKKCGQISSATTSSQIQRAIGPFSYLFRNY